MTWAADIEATATGCCCQSTTDLAHDDPRRLVLSWLHQVNDGANETLLSLYDDEAVLLPTFSARQRQGKAAMMSYSEGLAAYDELTVMLDEAAMVLQPGPVPVVSGTYCWQFRDGLERKPFDACFTFIFDGSGRIVHHHSSLLPDGH
jgi:hypothetical protein